MTTTATPPARKARSRKSAADSGAGAGTVPDMPPAETTTVKTRTPRKPGIPGAPADRVFYQSAILLKQLSDPTRLRIAWWLGQGERHVGDLCTALGQSQPAVSHHLALLRHGGFIEPRRQWKNNFYRLSSLGMSMLSAVNTVIERIGSPVRGGRESGARE
jgi:ArsR family transcriptional regulator, zinc-responsive transcriptional repressor